MEILNINLTASGAGSTLQFRKAGSYFEILEAVGAVGVRFWSGQGAQTNSIDGGLSGLYLDADFGAFDVVNQSGSAQTVKVLVCDAGESGGSRRQPGIVSVVDGEKQKVINGQCFRGSNSIAGATGKPTVQLWNPVGSGKNLFVQAIRLGSSQADAYAIGTETSALPTNGGGIGNLRRTGAASVAQIMTDNTNAAVAGLVQLAGGYVAASTDNVILFPRPILLEPGQGVMAFLGLTTSTIRINFEWEEWPI